MIQNSSISTENVKVSLEKTSRTHPLIIVTGSAGCGKSLLANALLQTNAFEVGDTPQIVTSFISQKTVAIANKENSSAFYAVMDTPPPEFCQSYKHYFDALNDLLNAKKIEPSSVAFLYLVKANEKLNSEILELFKLHNEKLSKFCFYVIGNKADYLKTLERRVSVKSAIAKKFNTYVYLTDASEPEWNIGIAKLLYIIFSNIQGGGHHAKIVQEWIWEKKGKKTIKSSNLINN